MPRPFDLAAYVEAMRSRWRRVLVTVALAGTLALAGSLLLPRRYDATVLLLIQPPATNSPYPAAMSPSYLEFLRSYEQFVQSDGLLAKLLAETALDQPPWQFTPEQFRRGALRATVARNSKLLSVTVRLRDPKKAHEAATKLAELAARSNAGIQDEQAARVREQTRSELEAARRRLASAQAELEKFRRESREDERARQAARQLERRARQQEEVAELNIGLAEKEARLAGLRERAAGEPDKVRLEQRGQVREVLNPALQVVKRELELTSAEVEGLRARRVAMRDSIASLDAFLEKEQAALAALTLRRQDLERERDLAQGAFNSLAGRAQDLPNAVALRNEELQVADRGTVPARPSAPNVPLNVFVAVFLALAGSLLYETWAWNVEEQRRAAADREVEALVHSAGSGLFK